MKKINPDLKAIPAKKLEKLAKIQLYPFVHSLVHAFTGWCLLKLLDKIFALLPRRENEVISYSTHVVQQPSGVVCVRFLCCKMAKLKKETNQL